MGRPLGSRRPNQRSSWREPSNKHSLYFYLGNFGSSWREPSKFNQTLILFLLDACQRCGVRFGKWKKPLSGKISGQQSLPPASLPRTRVWLVIVVIKIYLSWSSTCIFIWNVFVHLKEMIDVMNDASTENFEVMKP